MSFWNPYSLGLDFGTSGARAIAINAEGHIVSESRGHWAAGDCANPQAWRDALETLLSSIPLTIRQQLQRISINGTSGTVLLCDGEGNPITDPLLYNDDRGKSVQEQLHALAPPHHLVQSSTSSLAKLLYWHTQGLWDTQPPTSWQLLHQADWLALFLHGQPRYSDYHNALKLGYDVVHLTYPDWLRTAPFASLLPQVIAPGSPIAPILPEQAQRWDLSPHCWICAGTTDSIAAFLASGVTTVGEAVTSLGSTLVLKLLSDQYVTDLSLGIYSHRLGNQWLVGGASNSGGAVLRHFFSSEELHTLSEHINPQTPPG
jgi:sugar (pentulose or hexulose) kinase